MFCAAIADTNTTSMFIRDVAKFINQTPTSGPVSDLYDVRNAEYAPNVVFVSLFAIRDNRRLEENPLTDDVRTDRPTGRRRLVRAPRAQPDGYPIRESELK